MRSSTLLILSGVLAACVDVGRQNDDALVIGALLPFSGTSGAAGSNIEDGLLLLAKEVNDAGGIAGREVRIVALDTHAQLSRGLSAAEKLLEEPSLIGVVGPQSEDLARRVVPLVVSRQVVQVAAGVTSPSFTTIFDDGLWFRTNPSAVAYAGALAERIAADGVKSVTILYESDEYGSGMAAMLVNEFLALDIQTGPPFAFEPDGHSYVALMRDVVDLNREAIVLIAQPINGAVVVQDWVGLSGSNRWYLSPSLRAPIFLNNIPPGALDSAIGVAPELSRASQDFRRRYEARWGAEPSDAAYFYYDAAALVVLAAAASVAADDALGQVPSGPSVSDQIGRVSGPEGELVRWADWSRALELIGQGEEIDYEGVTGPVNLDRNGDLADAKTHLWTIQDHRFQDLPR